MDTPDRSAAATAEWLDALDARFKAEETEGWRIPANRTTREYAARQARMAVKELRYSITFRSMKAGKPRQSTRP